MGAVAVDTHSIVWYLNEDPRLSASAYKALDQATVDGEIIHVPSICLVELTYLTEKGRIPKAARERLVRVLDDLATPCRLAPLDRSVVDALELVSRNDVPDLPDRIVCATALSLNVPLVTRDGKIRTSSPNHLVRPALGLGPQARLWTPDNLQGRFWRSGCYHATHHYPSHRFFCRGRIPIFGISWLHSAYQ